jgi:hypothetical protein
MGMGLFYVTVLRFFFWGGDGVSIGGFAGVFEGGFGKSRFFAWCFCGEFVVDCVVIVVARVSLVWSLKIFHLFEVYFRGQCGKTEKVIPFWERCTKGLNGLRFFALILGPFSL